MPTTQEMSIRINKHFELFKAEVLSYKLTIIYLYSYIFRISLYFIYKKIMLKRHCTSL